jgi:hypothetical protein
MDNYVIKNSLGKGNGVFSTVNLPANHTIFEFVGKVLLRQDIPDFSGTIASNYLQIGPTQYLDLAGTAPFYINHACLPNCMIKIIVNRAFLVSIQPIKIGDELTFDYSTTSTETPATWSMACKCNAGQFQCRKTITGFSSVPVKQQQKYIANGMVPNYVIVK